MNRDLGYAENTLANIASGVRVLVKEGRGRA
jgi:hypothetical protein